MKESTKAWIAIPSALIVAAVPVTGLYLFWSWCMSQVPMTCEWAGLIKIGISLAILIVGGGITTFLSIGSGALVLALMVAILE